MSTFEFKSPDGKTYVIEGPDGATKEQAFGILQQQISSGSVKATTAPAKPQPDQSKLSNALAIDNVLQGYADVASNFGKIGSGVRSGVADIGDTILNLSSKVAPKVVRDWNADRTATLEADNKTDMQDPAFAVGRIGGNIAATWPVGGLLGQGAKAVGMPALANSLSSGGFQTGLQVAKDAPLMTKVAHALQNGATRTAGGALTGGASAGLIDPEHMKQGAVLGGILPGAMQALRGAGNAITNKIAARQDAELARQSQNAVRDETIANAKNAGLVLSPSEVNPSMLNHALEGLAGKLSTRQLASQQNQAGTNALARKEVGLAADAPLTSAAMQKIRKDAYQAGYAPIENAGNIPASSHYVQDLNKLVDRYQGAARSFPSAADDTVKEFVNGLKVQSFDAGDALKMTQLLRDQAADAFRKGESGLGLAKRGAAKAIEDEIERWLATNGSAAGLLKGFRDARTLMAKAHTVEDAIKEGSGNVIASKLAARLQAGKPLSGGLKTIAETANVFPKNMQSPEMMGAVPGFSPLDVFTGAGLGVMGAGATGDQWGALAALTPMLRPAARGALLSKPYQNFSATPTYGIGTTQKLIQALTQGVDSAAPTVDPVLSRALPALLRE